VSEPNAQVLRPGHRIALGQDVYTVIQLNGTITMEERELAKLAAPHRRP
jgi:hypothetical protein